MSSVPSSSQQPDEKGAVGGSLLQMRLPRQSGSGARICEAGESRVRSLLSFV